MQIRQRSDVAPSLARLQGKYEKGKTMARVSVLGSGMMGSALSRVLLKGGHDVMVLDLDPEKTKPLVELGATAASSEVELAEHAEVLIPSLPSYAPFEAFLKKDDVLSTMKGKTIVQLSSGSPQTVQAFSEFIAGTGVDYLEGRIKNYPKDIGSENSKIIFSGDEDIFLRSRPVLSALAARLEYLGPNLVAVSVLDEAVVTASYGQFWSLALAGRFVQAHGISPLTLLELLRETTPVNLDDVGEVGYPDLISGEHRENSGTAPLPVWISAGEETINAIRAAGLDTSVLESIQALLTAAVDKGLGNKGIMSIADVLAK
jgi:3-hydroxyisobutyrate dehydrogenase-like beta-hydroxyacid dehydrogenase